jgi:cysteinyl-tRNA synthetase
VLSAAAGRPDTAATPAATAEVTAALLADLDVPRAVAVAREQGGAAARHLLRTLALL